MLFNLLKEKCIKYSEKTAIVYNDQRITYKHLLNDVNGLSDGLKSIGVGQSDAIAVLIPNCPEFILSFFAIAKMKAIIVPVNPSFKKSEIENYLERSKVKVLITDTNHSGICQSIIEKWETKPELIVVNGDSPDCINFKNLIFNEDGLHDGYNTNYAGDFIYLFSSGSTGRPKRITRSQANYVHEMQGFIQATQCRTEDNILCAIPLFHSHGIGSCILPSIGAGATLVILEQFSQKGSFKKVFFIQKLNRVFQLIQNERITFFPAVPYIFHAMAGSSLTDHTSLSNLKLCFSSGNYLPKDIFDDFLDKFKIPIRQIYGCSEAGAVAINMAGGDTFKFDSVGDPLKDMTVKIVNDDGVELPHNQVGEIAIKSPALTKGYDELPLLNEDAFKNEFFFTGDLGKINEHGLTITGRKKLIIDTGGNKVDPIEIEDIINSHPKVAETVVLGVSGTSGNEIVKAVIVLREPCEKSEILSYCKCHLADFKIPKIIEYRKEIPKNPVGKILRKDLVLTKELSERAENLLIKIISDVLRIPFDTIHPQESFEHYGIDSTMILELNAQLEKHFVNLPKTLFFEYDNIYELAQYLIKNNSAQLSQILELKEPGVNSKNEGTIYTQDEIAFSPNAHLVGQENFKNGYHTSQSTHKKSDDIAIIGVNGRYPAARNLKEYWENLVKRMDCIIEIPLDRWDKDKYYDTDRSKEGKSYSKWGGFLNDIDKFDPLIFNISPKDAESIDPQERLFLETVWATLEDAGYSRDYFKNNALHRNEVGVFVGIMWGNYQLFGVEEFLKGNKINPPNSHFWAIPNRVSHFFNFQGPSLAIDTACSSSLTAVHMACESIKREECTMAIAGGVNLSLHPIKYIMTTSGQLLSSDGKCRSFGEGGDGYVPGEGVGAVLLKPLEAAIADRDNIYALIKGTSINHGGKTRGFTTPNPQAQARAISKAFEMAKVDPRTVSYVEASATGTLLGDPIEIRSLSMVFDQHSTEKQYCAIGSVKSNIGHLESAAGIAGLTKVLLQMKHKHLVPSIHSESLNPNINFKDSPFYIQKKLEEWKQPVIKENGGERTYPRRAGLSSFGAGGSNAHIIMEEYEIPKQELTLENQRPQIIVLSAKNEERLNAYAGEMVSFFKSAVVEKKVEKAVDEDLIQNIEKDLLKAASDVVKISKSDIDLDEDIREYGFDQISFSELTHRINEKYTIEISPTIFSKYSSIRSIALYLHEECKGNPQSTVPNLQSPITLADIAYTLQMGREAMEERLAMVVSSKDELLERLIEYYHGGFNEEKIYRNNISTNKSNSSFLIEGREGKEFINIIIEDRNLKKLAQLWVAGVEIDWKLLYPTHPPNRISLPTYPFERKRYWISINNRGTDRHPLSDADNIKSKKDSIKSVIDVKQFDNLPEESSLSKLTDYLQEEICNLLGINLNELGSNRSLYEFGFDSIKAIKLKYLLEKALPIEIPMSVFGESYTLTQLATNIFDKTDFSAKNLNVFFTVKTSQKTKKRKQVYEDAHLLVDEFLTKKNDLSSVFGEELDKLFEILKKDYITG